RYEPKPGGELAGPLEAVEVTDLEAEHERGQGVDAAKATQSRDRRPPLALLGEPREPFVEGLLARHEPVDRGERVEEGELGHRLPEPPPREPLPVRPGPGRALWVDATLEKQQLGDTVAAAHQIGAHLLPGTAEVTRSLNLPARHRDRLQLPCE